MLREFVSSHTLLLHNRCDYIHNLALDTPIAMRYQSSKPYHRRLIGQMSLSCYAVSGRSSLTPMLQLVLVLVTLLTLPSPSDSTWMYLGLQTSMLSTAARLPASNVKMPSTRDHPNDAAAAAAVEDVDDGEKQCERLQGLVMAQLEVCERNPMAMPCVGLGARLGLLECRYQFQNERWNCSISPPAVASAKSGTNVSSVDTLIQLATKETAFIYAATSAGVALAVTEACSAGNLTDCSCDVSRHGETTPDGWKWGGCSDNLQYGIWFSESFVDAPDRIRQQEGKKSSSIRALMNLHNNEVGRKVLSSLMKMRCRCHGVSGSCGVKTCWRSVPPFREVGDQLKKKYETSVEISPKPASMLLESSSSFVTVPPLISSSSEYPSSASAAAAAAALRRREKRKRREPISDTELVYVDRSPNYCRPDPARGVFGTRGRECRRESYGPESCESLCCGRGFNVEEVRRVERCHCRFVWCCEVKCKSCETVEKRYTCK